jgi:hypothetical protein
VTGPLRPTDGAAEEAVDNPPVPPRLDDVPGAAASADVAAEAGALADAGAQSPAFEAADRAAAPADVNDEAPTLDDFEPIYRPVVARPATVSPPIAMQLLATPPPILPPPTQLPFATPVAAPPVPRSVGAPVPSGGGSGRLFGFIAAAIVILGLGGGVAVAAMLMPPGASPTAVAAASPTPSPTPGASPDESAEPGAIDILHAFRDKVLVKDLAFRMTADGLYTEPSGVGRWNGKWEVSGKDYHVVLKTAGASSAVDAYIIGNKAWLKNTKGKYAVAMSSLAEWRWVPFLDIIEIKSLGYGGTRKRDGTTYHVLTSNGWYAPDNGRMLNRPGIGSATTKSLELLVTRDGVPHFATYRMTIDDGGRQATGTVEFTFTKVGEPITLKVPKK